MQNTNEWIDKINQLDLSLFSTIPSQTSAEDRRSLLAVQRITSTKRKKYVYLEIGSHLGGSIQPHLVDGRCSKIYSIDARPAEQPDDRSPGYIAYYDNNSTERMLNMLSGIGDGDVSKIKNFDLDASQVDLRQIASKPDIIFIDGAHTKPSVISDFQFSVGVLSGEGTILFHDFSIIYPAILEICRQLEKQHRKYLPLKLEGEMFAIFFDKRLVYEDQYLLSLYRKNKNLLRGFRVKAWIRTSLPLPLFKSIMSVRFIFRRFLPGKA